MSFSTDPTFLATFEVVSTDANGNGGLSTSELFNCLMFGPEFEEPGSAFFQVKVDYRNSMKP